MYLKCSGIGSIYCLDLHAPKECWEENLVGEVELKTYLSVEGGMKGQISAR